MTDLPDWASDELRRNWPALSDDDQRTIIADRDADLLRRAESQMRGSELDRSDRGGNFTIDGLQDDGYQWHAAAFGEPWNGWSTPIVTAATLQNMIDDLAQIDGQPFGEIQSDGELIVYGEEPEDNYTVTPNSKAEYALFPLGWCFLAWPTTGV